MKVITITTRFLFRISLQVPFLHQLLGAKSATHRVFSDSEATFVGDSSFVGGKFVG